MPHELHVYAIAFVPPGIRLARPVMTAAANLKEAAKILKVSRYHLSVHRLPMLDKADKERALARPRERLPVEVVGHA